MEPIIQPQQSTSNNKHLILTTGAAILVTAILFGFGVYMITQNSFNSEKKILEKKISDLQTQIDQFKSNAEITRPTPVVANADNIDTLFANMTPELLHRDSKISLTPTEGYVITTSIISHNGNKVVYSEISDCINIANLYGYDGQPCNWKYQMFVKDVKTNEVNKIYSYPKSTSSLQNIQQSIINKAQAGGCPTVLFPLAWSKNDQKIVLQWGNPTSCGSGGAPKYLTQTLNPSDGSLEDLSTYNPIFLDSYNKVVFIDESIKSPAECTIIAQSNQGKIVLKYIETGKTVILAEEPNSAYSGLRLDEDGVTLHYSIKKVVVVDGCSEIDPAVPEKIKQIQLP